jgi:hypothetical protein
MINSRPKQSTLFSVTLALVGILAVDAWILTDLLSNPSAYFFLKLVLAPTLLVIAIIVISKSYFSALHLSLGDNKISYRYLLGKRTSHSLKEIAAWSEEVINRKNSEYRRLTIKLNNGKKLRLSNHENSEYKMVINYLNKKAKKFKR